MERHALTTAEFAKAIGTSERSIQRRIAEKKLLSFLFGGSRRIPRSELDRLLSCTPALTPPGSG